MQRTAIELCEKTIFVGEVHLDMWSPIPQYFGGEALSRLSFLNVESVEELLARKQFISDATALDEENVVAFHHLMLRPY